MMKVVNGQAIRFRFGFVMDGIFFNPLSDSSPVDVHATVIRGQNGSGNIIKSTVSLINSSYRIISVQANGTSPTFTFDVNHKLILGNSIQVYGIGGGYDSIYNIASVISSTEVVAQRTEDASLNLSSYNSGGNSARATLINENYFVRISESEYNFVYTVPQGLFGGIYTLVIETINGIKTQTIEHIFQVAPQQSTKTGIIKHKKIKDNVVTLTTQYAHGLTVGSFVSVLSIDNKIDGSYYISDITAENKFSFKLNATMVEEDVAIFGNYVGNQIVGVSGQLTGPTRGTSISYRPIYDSMELYSTNSILLIGHSDGLELNEITKINSMQEATNILGANLNSPLLRGVYDAYSCGARNIFVVAAAPMSEYIDDVEQRLDDNDSLISEITEEPINFYEKYYERLQKTYLAIKDYDLIDIIVPLEVSIIKTGNVDFVTQLAYYCYDFNNTTGFVQLGIIGSRSSGIKDSDIAILESNPIFKNKLTAYASDGQIFSDAGRYIIPIYGELTFSHVGFNRAYTSSAAAAFAGAMSSNPVYNGMIRKRISGAFSVFGANLSSDSLVRLDNLGINAIYRSRRATRGNPYEAYVSNDYTMANTLSTFTKAPQMRLVAMVINEIKSISNDGLGKSAEDKVTDQVKTMLKSLVAFGAIKNYSLQAYGSKVERGHLIFEITLLSSLGLKNINFSVATGPGA